MRIFGPLIVVAALCLAALSGCQSGPEPAVEGREALYSPHPRLLLTQEAQAALKENIRGSHEWLWERFREDLPRMLEAGDVESLPADLNRGHAGLAPELAFAWVLTGSEEHFRVARRHLLNLSNSAEWNPENDLVHGHLLQGMALAYDWLHESLSPEDRATVAGRLARECENQYQRMTEGRVWYHNQYYQNHAVSNFCGLAYAACALYDEDERTEKWLGLCEDFFEIVFPNLPPDGTSLEGISYGAYDFEYLMRYAVLAEELLGNDLFDNRGLRKMPAWFLHSMVPSPEPGEWTMTWGDAPRHASWHGPEPQLYIAASKYGDGRAQWLANYLINLEPEGLASAGLWALLWYDPSVQEADPSEFPTFHHFDDNGQVMMRSSWTDPSATLVGFKCGPWMGRSHSLTAEWDWGTNHQEPDQGSFQVFSKGEYLTIDPLYTTFKRTANHSVMLFKGNGQLGEDIQWFGVAEALYFRHFAEVPLAETNPAYDYVVGDVAGAYHPALGLNRYERHLVFVKPDVLVTADVVSLAGKGMLHSFPAKMFEVTGSLEHGAGDYVVGTTGEAYVEFTGTPGDYVLTVNYLDNFPGEGSFALAVDGDTVHAWRTEPGPTDNHFILTEPVRLERGSRISFLGKDMPHNCRMIRMTAFSRDAEAGRSATWLMQLDESSEIQAEGGMYSSRLGDSVIDVYTGDTGPYTASTVLEDWEVLHPDTEIEATRRLVLTPSFRGDNTVVVSVLHSRYRGEPALEDVRWSLDESGEGLLLNVSWELEGESVRLAADLGTRTIELE